MLGVDLGSAAELLNVVPEAILIRDWETRRVLYWSDGAVALYGVTREEAIGRNADELVQVSFPRPLAEIQAEVDREGHWEGEIEQTTRDGRHLLVASRWAVQRDAEQRPVGIVIANRDVTTLRHTLQALEESEARYRALVELAPEPIAVIQHGKVAYINAAGARALGYEAPAHLVGRTAWDLVSADRREEIGARLEELLAGRLTAITGLVHLIQRDGSIAEMEVVATPVQYASAPAIQMALRDRTRQLALERRRDALLRVARALSTEIDGASLLETVLQEAMAATDADSGVVRRWDDQARKLVVVKDTMSGQRRQPSAQGLEEGLSGRAATLGKPVIDNVYFSSGTPAANGGMRCALAVPLLHEGRLLGTIGIGTANPDKRFTTDDADLLELLAGLASSVLIGHQRARLAGVQATSRAAQHYLNNQLALTAGYAELLAQAPELPDRLRGLAREAVAGAHAASAMVNRLRLLTPVEEPLPAAPGNVPGTPG